MSTSSSRALYVNARREVRLELESDSIRVSRPQRADTRIPLRRVRRAVITASGEGLLAVCLEIVRRGGTVHFQTAGGAMEAVLHQARPTANAAVRELAAAIDCSSGAGAFRWWREVQLLHAWSLAFRRRFRGDFAANRKRLLRYLRQFRPDVPAERESALLRELLHAWLQAEIDQHGLQPVVEALSSKGCELVEVLERCLEVRLLWRYVRWRRQQAHELERPALVRFFELAAAVTLPEQLQRHLDALRWEYMTRAHGPSRTSEQAAEARRKLRIP
ncbi:hypothetical protein [Nitrococcus mobilis]|uniref:Uncharacterized protein n=1 Tax=Nitrococcus mobilis Nb-231 TaxID=314278 RepID=A4BL57_9GAMM|nr:hypothetical protein [Nitrococcus mobilis]EAR23045.1 hypothetical protein NB231_14533 [Nitrococcus mobilis Nb-231]